MPQLTRGNCRETRDKFYGMEPLNMQLPYKRSMPRLHAFKKTEKQIMWRFSARWKLGFGVYALISVEALGTEPM